MPGLSPNTWPSTCNELPAIIVGRGAACGSTGEVPAVGPTGPAIGPIGPVGPVIGPAVLVIGPTGPPIMGPAGRMAFAFTGDSRKASAIGAPEGFKAPLGLIDGRFKISPGVKPAPSPRPLNA